MRVPRLATASPNCGTEGGSPTHAGPRAADRHPDPGLPDPRLPRAPQRPPGRVPPAGPAPDRDPIRHRGQSGQRHPAACSRPLRDPARPGGRRCPARPARSRLPAPSSPPLPREPARLRRPGDAPGQLRERPQRAPPSHPVGDGILLPPGCPPGDGADRHPAGQPVLRIRRAGAAARGAGAVRCGRYRDHRPLRPVAPGHGQHRRPPPLHGQVPVHPHERAARGHVGPSRRGIRPGRG